MRIVSYKCNFCGLESDDAINWVAVDPCPSARLVKCDKEKAKYHICSYCGSELLNILKRWGN